MGNLIGSFEGQFFRATLYDNEGAAFMHSHEVILTRKMHPRESLVIDAGRSEPCELVEVAASLVSLRGNWHLGPASRKSSDWHFEMAIDHETGIRLAQLHFHEMTPGEPEPRWITVHGPDEAEDLLAVAKEVATRHAQLNLLSRGFDPEQKPIATVKHGRFQAEVYEDRRTFEPSYWAALYADGKVLWPPDSGSRCWWLLERLDEGGRDWLDNYLTARNLPPSREKDLLDFQNALAEAQQRCRALWELGRPQEQPRALQARDLSKEPHTNELMDAVVVAGEGKTTTPEAAFAEGLNEYGGTERERGKAMSKTSDTPVTEKSGLEHKPLAKLACGDIRGSVWLNQSENGDYLTVSFARVYKAPDGTTKTTHSYGSEHLADLSEAALEAKKLIQEESLKLGLKQRLETQRVRITR
jgi:hypothetical protein